MWEANARTDGGFDVVDDRGQVQAECSDAAEASRALAHSMEVNHRMREILDTLRRTRGVSKATRRAIDDILMNGRPARPPLTNPEHAAPATSDQPG